jgi:ABC-type thiamine transport system substrate-binding protein
VLSKTSAEFSSSKEDSLATKFLEFAFSQASKQKNKAKAVKKNTVSLQHITHP